MFVEILLDTNLIHNANKSTDVKKYTFTYNQLILRHVSIFFRSSSWSFT